MSKHHNHPREKSDSSNEQSRWALPIVGLILLAAVIGIVFVLRQDTTPNFLANSRQDQLLSTNAPAPNRQQAGSSPTIVEGQPAPDPSGDPLSMEVATAVMVTVELDFPQRMPTIAEALNQVERRYQPDDGQGRTFAILDAYGEPTAAGKLHLSMHVSSEKPGMASLIFRPTGAVLWSSRITAATKAPASKRLTVYINDDANATWIVDGSGNPSSILEAKLRDKGVPVRDFWPDGAEREVTFVYSACGCPVKVMARRIGERTARTTDLPVIFPDDPAAVQTIASLMKW